ncbi:MAG TPA: kelch repeat-containing protein, partial [Thermoplasmata archaeon]|nr:kelch repeat-containing protein [Thermoplasmata archaeon]
MLVLVSVSLFAFVMISPDAAAAARTWTTDVDFNEAGSVFLSTEVVGTGAPAKVELIKSTTDWANKNPANPTPGNLESPSMAYDELGGVTVLFGGYNGLAPNLYSDKTWEYNWALNTWTEITGSPHPSLRQSSAMSYDPVEQVMVLFGGYNDTDFLTDTWEYDVATNTWAQITTAPNPNQMATYTLVYHASASRHLMVGSDFSQNIVVWQYDAAADTWQQRFPFNTPSARSGFATAYHAARDRTVLFGGSNFMTLYDQT